MTRTQIGEQYCLEFAPCPFCGGKPRISRCEERDGGYYEASCNTCELTMARIEDVHQSAFKKLLDGWNKRTSCKS